MTQQLVDRTEMIQRRIDPGIVGTIGVSTTRGLAVESMAQALEVAKLMAVSDCAVPKHMRNNPGACLAVAVQGWEWGINPFAIANKSYVVNDRLAYEAALYHAVLLKRAPIKGRIKVEYLGDAERRVCRVWAIDLDGDVVEYRSPETGKITPKNSPLWRNDPDQQLFYFSVRALARRHYPDVMMGIYTADELIDSPPMEVQAIATKPVSRSADLNSRITGRPVSEGQTFVPETGEIVGDALPETQLDSGASDHSGVPSERGAKAQQAVVDAGADEERPKPAEEYSADDFTPTRTLEDLKALAERKMPTSLPSPDDGIKKVVDFIKLHAPKGLWKNMAVEKRQALWTSIVDGSFAWK